MRGEKRWLRYGEMAPGIFLLATKYFPEPNVQNNKFHGI